MQRARRRRLLQRWPANPRICRTRHQKQRATAAVDATCRAGRKQQQPPTATDDSIPPFPWRSVVSILLVNLSEPLAITLLFPFAPFLVADHVPADQVGVYAGLLATTYNVAGIPANLFWGRLSDRRGRKPALAACLVGTAVCLVPSRLSRSRCGGPSARASSAASSRASAACAARRCAT